jgi:hypothetical protein
LLAEALIRRFKIDADRGQRRSCNRTVAIRADRPFRSCGITTVFLVFWALIELMLANKLILVDVKVHSRAGFSEETCQSRQLRDLFGLRLRNFRAKRNAFAARVFYSMSEMRIAKRIPIGGSS